MAALAPAPASLYRPDGSIADGQYLGPVADPALRLPPLWGRLRQKQWHYLSLLAGHHFVAVAVVQLRYVANCFVYAVDLREPAVLWQTEALSPFGLAARFAPASHMGTTTWRSAGTKVAIAASDGGWHLQLDATLHGPAGQTRLLAGSAKLQVAEALSLVHRLASGHPAYTRKDAGMQATAALDLAGTPINGPALATSDWTQSLALRVTRWNWASLVAHLPDGRRLGINLSAHVYDDAQGQGRENAVWLDGQLHLLGGVQFALPADPVNQPWRITGGEVDLQFTPLGARRQNLNFGLVASRFVQPYGRFSGAATVAGERIAIDGAVGVVEDHLARW